MNKLSQIPDLTLLEQIKKDNKIAFGELYNRYWEELVIFALKHLHDREAAKDIVQEVFCKVWGNRQKLEVSKLRAYLFRAVKNGVIDHVKASPLKTCDEYFLSNQRSINYVEEAINFNETSQKLKTLVEGLPSRSREVFYLSRYAHLSNDDIANKLSMSKSTVEWHISKALKRIRLSLPEVHFTTWIISMLFY
ncbi:RNA polymerase sigma-70 factor [Fulvivirgaceae bacterium BMA10]|uniref:RNA polymerase sigma-70 factor n=1 Tax=Splendidivirga corallicola TaxID=3051826 RepID=A0ABT8KPQ8_9BACT|nr:RNA polymerase sigma-70 factor [Fulvivirgaceae bacterium BMA10]